WRSSLRTVRRLLGGRWRFGSEGLVTAEHVPDRLGESAGEVDLGDLGAALFADPRFGLLVAVAVDGCGAGVGGGLDERPAQILGPLFGERAAQVAFAGLVDARAEAGVAGEFARCGEAADGGDLRGERVSGQPTDPRGREQEGHGAMVGAESAEFTGGV